MLCVVSIVWMMGASEGIHAANGDYPAVVSCLDAYNDLGEEVGGIIIHGLNADFVPTRRDRIIGPTEAIGPDGELTCFWFLTDSGSGNVLLSYRHHGKLYQYVVSSTMESTVIKLSEFIEQAVDTYFFGNENAIRYTREYCRQLARKVQVLRARHGVMERVDQLEDRRGFE